MARPPQRGAPSGWGRRPFQRKRSVNVLFLRMSKFLVKYLIIIKVFFNLSVTFSYVLGYEIHGVKWFFKSK